MKAGWIGCGIGVADHQGNDVSAALQVQGIGRKFTIENPTTYCTRRTNKSAYRHLISHGPNMLNRHSSINQPPFA